MAVAVARPRTRAAKKRPPSFRGISVATDAGLLRIPSWVVDNASFLKWSESEPLLEQIRVCYLAGEIWVETEMEEFFAHGDLKVEVALKLGQIINKSEMGYIRIDKTQYTFPSVDLTSEPDVIFVSYDSIESGRAKLVDSKRMGVPIRVEGSVEMVAEIMSDSSVEKDDVQLPDLYYRAGVKEYWQFDGRDGKWRFDLHRRGPSAFELTPKQPGGWMRSDVFNKSFRLVRGTDKLGHPKFRLSVR